MRFTLIAHVTATDPAARLSDAGLAHTREVLAATPGVTMARLYTPATARDLYTDDGPSPALAFQLYFDELTALEAAAGPAGPLRRWPTAGGICRRHGGAPGHAGAGLPGARAEAGRHAGGLFLPRALPRRGGGPERLAHLLHRPSPADHGHLPGVREIEILTRVDWCDALPWQQRVAFMQRNRLMFDSPAALEAALQSPVRHVMRADFENFPPFEAATCISRCSRKP
ncbi:hypothetical protein [Paroceanicella profunda]|uniref:hypothetical protein n=1 Tax=Paroceanicella profunda TaxID=2579971 RepID=UPI001EEFE349|nr:hypothetical protein [Paroceanicella profunda]